jgi:hypothetical protein
MPIEQPHPLITEPTDSAERVWRYMDFAKFISLLSRRQLFFCNLEVLASSDPHEGLLAHPNYRHREWHTVADLTPEEHKAIFGDTVWTGDAERIQFESQKNAREYWLKRRFYDRKTLLVNCWHLNRYESAAMWLQYTNGGQGVAITSSYERIIEAFADVGERIFCGLVRYLDWDTERVDDTFILPFSKRMSFRHESELRLVFWDLEVQEKVNALCQILSNHTMDHLYRRIAGSINWSLVEREIDDIEYKRGFYISADLDKLIDQVYVAPTSPDWYLEIAKEICARFGLRRVPVRSDILSSPLR